MTGQLGFMGIDVDPDTAKVVLIPVPWEVTTSYGAGTARGPEAILQASPQLDLYDDDVKDAYKAGYFWTEENSDLAEKSQKLKPKNPESIGAEELKSINSGCQDMVDWVYKQTLLATNSQKIPAVVGGDHSVSFGIIKALSELHKGEFGILHIDAHMDLRQAYQGFTHSHASIMHNVMALPHAPQQLVQVGIRDYCEEELEYSNSNSAIQTYFDRETKKQLFKGRSWDQLCGEMINKLPKKVYVSFDIDGLSPEFCPGTGTPVPGGLSFDQAVHLLAALGESGRQLVGFDLVEVSPQLNSDWDGNVGARLLQKLCGWTVLSNG